MMKRLYAALHSNDDGATMVEYGLMVALIAIVVIAAVAIIGDNLNNTFTTVGESVGEATP